MNILEPKIWWEGLYHATCEERAWAFGAKEPYIELRRLCEKDRRYEGEQDVYWPSVTCLACVALELPRDIQFVKFTWHIEFEDP